MRSGPSCPEKQRNCDPANPEDDHRGDSWDYEAFDPEYKLVLAAVPGARTEENARATVAEVGLRAGCDPPPLMTSDEYPAYATAIEEVFRESRRKRGPVGVPAPPMGNRQFRQPRQPPAADPGHSRKV